MPDIDQIDRFLQDTLARGNRDSVAAVEAAEWLNGAGFLDDSPDRPGLPLRKLLRAGQIRGQVQESNGRWFIHRVDELKKNQLREIYRTREFYLAMGLSREDGGECWPLVIGVHPVDRLHA